jgi:hypothetical protein
LQALGDSSAGHPLLDDQAVNLTHHLRLHLVDHHASVAIVVAHNRVAVRCLAEGQRLARPDLVQAPAAGAFDNLRALVLGDDALHLHQQPVLGALADGVFNEMDTDRPFGQLLNDHLLVHVVACKTIRTVHQDHVD